jgi:hypothetical protein
MHLKALAVRAGRFVLRWIGIMSGALALLMTFYLAMRETENRPVLGDETLVYLLYSAIVAFVISAGLSWAADYIEVSKLQAELTKLRNLAPKIETELYPDDFGWLAYVRVWNRGGAGTFHAQVERTGEDVHFRDRGWYTAPWTGSTDGQMKILRDQNALLHIVDGGTTAAPDEYAFRGLHGNLCVSGWGSSPKVFVSVRISSDPPAQNEPHDQVYVLTPGGLSPAPTG